MIWFPVGGGDEGIALVGTGPVSNSNARKAEEWRQRNLMKQLPTRQRDQLTGRPRLVKLTAEELKKLAEQAADCIGFEFERAPRQGRKKASGGVARRPSQHGLQLSVLSVLMRDRHHVDLREIKERHGYLSQRQIFQDCPAGFFDAIDDPGSRTGDKLYWPLGQAPKADGASVAAGTATPVAAIAAPPPEAAWAVAGALAEAEYEGGWLECTVQTPDPAVLAGAPGHVQVAWDSDGSVSNIVIGSVRQRGSGPLTAAVPSGPSR